MFAPFKNDHQSMQIGNLIIENQTEKVTIYGDIDIAKTKLGLMQAQKLQRLFTDMVSEIGATVEADDDSENIDANNNSLDKEPNLKVQTLIDTTPSKPSDPVKTIKNPFT